MNSPKKILLFLIILFILIKSTEQAQCKATAVIGKLLAAFGKCGLKVGLIDTNKLHHLLQIKHGFQALDPEQIVYTIIDMIPATKGLKILRITLKCGAQIVIRYA